MFEYIDMELVKAITLLMFSFLLYYASDDNFFIKGTLMIRADRCEIKN